MKRFPTGQYGRQRMQFNPAPSTTPIRAFAALMFPWCEDKVLVCDIDRRGWCIPSGRVEPGESSMEAALREAREEGGAIMSDVQYIGCYQMASDSEVRWADVFVGNIKELVEITHRTESLGRKLVGLEELPDMYHLWNPLTEMVFQYSYEVIQRSNARSR
ncbi:MAG: NUDIX domain-containing protein [Armatimonadetes bacterium]|nr:NUDIX domain-containing protein [Armatimonadota bacterium]